MPNDDQKRSRAEILQVDGVWRYLSVTECAFASFLLLRIFFRTFSTCFYAYMRVYESMRGLDKKTTHIVAKR